MRNLNPSVKKKKKNYFKTVKFKSFDKGKRKYGQVKKNYEMIRKHQNSQKTEYKKCI